MFPSASSLAPQNQFVRTASLVPLLGNLRSLSVSKVELHNHSPRDAFSFSANTYIMPHSSKVHCRCDDIASTYIFGKHLNIDGFKFGATLSHFLQWVLHLTRFASDPMNFTYTHRANHEPVAIF